MSRRTKSRSFASRVAVGRILVGCGVASILLGLTLLGTATVIRSPGTTNPFAVAGYLATFLGSILVFAGIAKLRDAAMGRLLPGLLALWLYSAVSWAIVLSSSASRVLFSALAGLPSPVDEVARGLFIAVVAVGTLLVMAIGLIFSAIVLPLVVFHLLRDRRTT
jgi:hypothetical protein